MLRKYSTILVDRSDRPAVRSLVKPSPSWYDCNIFFALAYEISQEHISQTSYFAHEYRCLARAALVPAVAPTWILSAFPDLPGDLLHFPYLPDYV